VAAPRESNTWLFGGRGSGDYELWKLIQRLDELAKSDAKLFCLTRDAPDISPPPNERYQRGFADLRV